MARTHSDNRLPNNPQAERDIQDEDILIRDEGIVPGNNEEPLSPDKIYTFFLKRQGNPPDLMGIDHDQLLAIQNDL